MYNSDVRRALLRRWKVIVVGLATTLVLCGAVRHFVPPKYEAKSSVLLLPPVETLGKGGNPYLALDGLQTTADVLSRAMTDNNAVQAIKQAGATETYTVEADPTTSGPVVLVTVDGKTAADVLATMKIVVNRLPGTLADLQSSTGVPSNVRIKSVVLTQDPTASALRKTQMRVVLVTAAAGIALTLLAAALLDGLWARRGRRGLASGAGDEGWLSGSAAEVAARERLVAQDMIRSSAGDNSHRRAEEAGRRH